MNETTLHHGALDDVLSAVLSEIDCSLHASLSMREGDGVVTVRTTDPDLDIEHDRDGPIAGVFRHDRIVRLPTNARTDEFPEYAKACRVVGVGSVAAFPVRGADRCVLAVLTITSSDHHGFTADDLRTGRRAAERLAMLLPQGGA